MALTAGARLGSYEITGPLGRGGMGEVYRATDTKLGRDVAIKMLPSALAQDAERLARFEREAKLLAALNHAHIASVYGLDEREGTLYLAMELVEGQTLEQRLEAGQLPIEDALHLALQIAEALEAAHLKGIVHRDLKPANVMVTGGGQVKVLDFGLAKTFSGGPNDASPGASPALSPAMTQQGLILGTAGYMSPEQASGQATDQRADIWAFGAVLYEMLTGLPLFSGESVQHLLADVLRTEPDWSRLPKRLHPRLKLLLERCLAKKPRDRLHSIADARLDIEDVLRDPQGVMPRSDGGPTHPARPIVIGVAVAASVAVVAVGTAFFTRSPTPAEQNRETTRFLVAPPEGTRLDNMSRVNGPNMALSPDGRQLAMVVVDAQGARSLAVRPLGALEPRHLAGTEGASGPFWSPDSLSIAFYAEGKLKRLDIRGGDVRVLCDSTQGGGGTWNRDDVIVFSPYDNGEGGLARVPATGGTPVPITMLDTAAGETNHLHPMFLPDGRQYLYFVGGGESAGIYIGDLDTGERARIIDVDSLDGQYTTPAYASGYLLFVKDQALTAQAFDPDTLELSGEAARVVDRVVTEGPGDAAYSVSVNGALVYWSGAPPQTRQLTWVNRDGSVGEEVGDPIAPFNIALSPDGRQVAATLYAPDERNWTRAVWLVDPERRISTKLTFEWGAADPVWSPDGTRIAFTSSRAGPPSVYAKPSAGGIEQLLFEGVSSTLVSDWSREDRLMMSAVAPGTHWDMWILPADGSGTAVPFLRTPFNELDGRLSPDGRWLAYVSNEGGRDEIYVTNVESGRDKWRISSAGGTQPQWRGDGRELFFVAPDNTLTAVAVPSEGDFQAGVKTRLFTLPRPERAYVGMHQYAASRDGQQFLVAIPVGEAAPSQAAVALNWPAIIGR